MIEFNSRAPDMMPRTDGIQVTHAQEEFPPAKNRADETKIEDVNSVVVKVGLYDIDETLIAYLNQVIHPTVEQNGATVVVPVLYANPERWKSVQKDGILRDKAGRLQLPVILLRRISLKPNKLNNPLNKYHTQVFTTRWNGRMAYDRFAVQNNIRPSEELISVTLPDYYDLRYEVIVWTEYIAQLNSLIEQISFETQDYWGQRNKYKFLVTVDEYKTDGTIANNADRMVKCTFTMMVKAYLLPDSMVDRQHHQAATSRVQFTKKKLVFEEKIITKL